MVVEKLLILTTALSAVFSLLAMLELARFSSDLRGLMYQVDLISEKLRALQKNLTSLNELRSIKTREHQS